MLWKVFWTMYTNYLSHQYTNTESTEIWLQIYHKIGSTDNPFRQNDAAKLIVIAVMYSMLVLFQHFSHPIKCLCYFPVNYTAPPSQTTTSGGSQTVITESLTTSMDIITITAPAVTAVDAEITSTIISRTDPSFQRSNCTLASATNSIETCPPLHQSSHANSELADEVASTLLDDDLTTCMRPFQNDPQLQFTINTQGSSLLRIQVTGEGLDCLQPCTLVFLDLSGNLGEATITHRMNKQECLLWASSHSQNYMTCTFECRPLVPCDGSLLIGVQVQNLSWLSRSQNLKQLCDVRAFSWA